MTGKKSNELTPPSTDLDAKKPAVNSDVQLPQENDFDNKQLDFFQTFYVNTDEGKLNSSNSIELWDSIPKYSISRKAMNKMRDQNGYLGIYKSTFQYRGRSLDIAIHPALIEVKKDGQSTTEAYYPSANEELIEEVLRKIASIQNHGFHENRKRTGVVFTLYQLREELRKRGHTRSYDEIVQSLNILSLSVIEIDHGDKKEKRFARSAYFPNLAGVTRKDLESDPNLRWFVQFHPLVTDSLDKLEYRQFNYQKLMSHSTQLARWVHKLIVNKWTNASMLHPFDIHYTTIKRDSAMLNNFTRERDAIKACDLSVNELVQQELLSKVERREVVNNKGKILDVVYQLFPSQQFIAEVKAANKRLKDARSALDGSLADKEV